MKEGDYLKTRVSILLF